jgi:hypothetical protein
MSFDLYHFQMVTRQQEMTRSERLAADEQAARITQAVSELGRAVTKFAWRPRRSGAGSLRARRIA